MYETILSPINYGGLQLKNRIIFAPTTFGLADEEYLARIRSIAEGGCAMIIVGNVQIHSRSAAEKITPDQLREKLNAEVAPCITSMSQRKIHEIIIGFGKTDTPLRPLQQKVSGRADGTSGNSLRL